MKRALIILALVMVGGCGLADRVARRDIFPPGDSISMPRDTSPGLCEPDPCQSMLPGWWCGDYDLSGGVDGDDLGAFWMDWIDGIDRTDVDGDGYAGTDCDLRIFLTAWCDGCMEGCF